MYLESYKSSRSEPAGLCRLGTQVTNALEKKGLWSLGEENTKVTSLGARGGGQERHSLERQHLLDSLCGRHGAKRRACSISLNCGSR